MSLKIELDNFNPVMITLRNVEKGMTQVFKQSMATELEKGKEMARKFLETASQERTGKRYWTGRLQSTIEAGSTFEKATMTHDPTFTGTVGIDFETRHPEVAHYAVPVEKGHKTGFGETFWAGYHFMENTYLEMLRTVGSAVAQELAKAIKTPWGWRNIATGQWTFAPSKI